jgi:hypothetical protein
MLTRAMPDGIVAGIISQVGEPTSILGAVHFTKRADARFYVARAHKDSSAGPPALV